MENKILNFVRFASFTAIAILLMVTKCEHKKEVNALEAQVLTSELHAALYEDSLHTIQSEVIEIKAQDFNVSPQVETVTVIKKDFKTAAELKRLKESYTTMADSLSAQRDRERREKEILEEYCIQLQEKNQTDSKATIDSLINETVFPLFFTQEDIPWYVIDVFVDTPDSARVEFYYADEYNITHRKIKKKFLGCLRPKDLEVSVTSLNPYSVGNSATTYEIKK